jgi:WhiB family redox-sensing transcriptional regulator
MSLREADMGWWQRAACKGMDTRIFFVPVGQTAHEAKAICATCPVQQECLDEALIHNDPIGIWGGTSVKERREIRRARGLVKPHWTDRFRDGS